MIFCFGIVKLKVFDFSVCDVYISFFDFEDIVFGFCFIGMVVEGIFFEVDFVRL